MSKQIYYKYSEYLKEKYGEKIYKIPIQLPLTCPNRINGAACTFCAEVGTGFEAMPSEITIKAQMAETKEKIRKKYKAEKYIAYFQNYTNTYLPLGELKRYVEEVVKDEDIIELSISTRPDCIAKEYLEYLRAVSDRTGIHMHIELGLQTANYHTLDLVSRGHGLAEFIGAVLLIKQYHFTICTHIILNLPYDSTRDMIETSKILSALNVEIVKIHSLYLAKNTVMYEEYQNGKFQICTKEEYFERLITFLEYLSPTIAVERLFSRIPEAHSAFSNWGCSWWKLYETVIEIMQTENRYQGKKANYLDATVLKEFNKS